ncbi:MAG: uroporphyrinogen decarboxylase family protein [Chloroflexota bacterium]|nr:uroporphyrinogen decarboxylase family protein [Chloroflexota bacterium]
MTKLQRVQAALAGHPVDRVPVSAWGHDFRREWTAEGLAQATLDAYRRYDWDFIKVNPRATYYAEDWGCRFQPSGRDDQGPDLVEAAVKSPADLRRLRPLDPTKGAYGQQLAALRLIGREMAGQAAFIQTVFSPLAVASRLAGGRQPIRQYMDEAPQDLEAALSVIAETLAAYARACLDAGASGIFFAPVEWATRDSCSDEQYQRFGRPYDLLVLAAVQGAQFNLLHVCRNNNMLESLLDYPVHAFHWAATGTGNPSLKDILAKTDKAVAGGVSHDTTLVDGRPHQVAAEARQALSASGGRRFLLTPGCSISPQTPEANLRAMIEVARGIHLERSEGGASA